ncbi:MAG: hypothetical protein IKT54_04330 [Clostridia bacterium]|nr:hypothetical protein [Clostridia bacterium]
MRFLRITALVALLLTSVLAVSCKDASSDVANEPTVTLDLVKNGETPFTIIRPEMDESGATVEQMKAIRDSFKENTGIRISMEIDWLKVGQEPDPEKYEILIGQTNRPESAEAIKGLKYHDYVVKVVGNKVVINGQSPEALKMAADYFINEVLSKAEEGSDLSVTDLINTVCVADYKYGKVTVLGNDLADYTITVPESADYTVTDFADKLQKLFADRTGYYLPIASSAEKNAISISYCNSADEWGYSLSEGNVVCRAHGLFGFDVIYDMLDSALDSGGELALDSGWNLKFEASMLKDEEIIRANSINGDIRVMFHNVWGSTVSNRGKMAAKVYLTYLPDVIGFQEYHNFFRYSDWSILISNEYEEVPAASWDENSVPIYYRTDKLELIECGWHRYNDRAGDPSKAVTWAVFKHKESGKQFGVANTHFYWTNDDLGKSARLIDVAELMEIVNDISDQYGAPFVVGGDLNCNISSDPLKILSQNGYVNAHDSATVYATTSGGYHGYPPTDPETGLYIPADPPKGDYSSAIDHVYLYGDAEASVYDYIIHPFSLAISDHSPVYVDVKLGN